VPERFELVLDSRQPFARGVAPANEVVELGDQSFRRGDVTGAGYADEGIRRVLPGTKWTPDRGQTHGGSAAGTSMPVACIDSPDMPGDIDVRGLQGILSYA
jgi:hypothetical protein